MIDLRNGLTVLFMAVGLIFMVISVIGVIKFPDIYSRLHAMTLGQELGVGFCCLGIFIYEGFTNAGVKILLLILVTMIAGPYRTHVISRVAYRESDSKMIKADLNNENSIEDIKTEDNKRRNDKCL